MPAGIDVGTLQATFSVIDAASPALQRMNDTIAESEQHVDSLGKSIALFGVEVLEATARKVDSIGQTFESLGKKLLLLAAAGPVAGAGLAYTATALNEMVANVSALLPVMDSLDLKQKTDEMTDGIQSLAIATGKSSNDIAEGLYEVVSSLGYTTDSFEQLNIAARAGIAGRASTIESFQLLNNVTKAYGDSSAQAFQKVGDLSFQAVNLGQTTYPELAAAIGGVVPIAHSMGVSMEEVFAILAHSTGLTGNTAEVVTQMTSALTGLETPGADLIKIYKDMGVETGKAAIAQYGMVGALTKVMEGSKKYGISITELLGRKEAWLLTTGLEAKGLEDVRVKMEAMTAAAGSMGGVLSLAFDRQAKGVNSVGFAWSQLRQTITTIAEKVGNLILPIFGVVIVVLQKVANAVLWVVRAFETIPNVVRGVLTLFVGLAGALGVLFIVFGTLIQAVIYLGAALLALAKGTIIIGLLKMAIMALGNAIGGLVGAKLVEIAGTKAMTLAWSGATTAVKAFLASTAGWTVMALASAAAGATLGSALLATGDRLRGLNDDVRKGVATVGLLKGAWILAGDAMRSFGSMIASTVFVPFKILGGVIGLVSKDVGNFVSKIGTNIWGTVAKGASMLGDVFYAIGAAAYDVAGAEEKAANGAYVFNAAGQKSIPTLDEWHKKMKAINDEVQKNVAVMQVATEKAMTDAEIRKKIQDQLATGKLEAGGKAIGSATPLKDLATAERVLALQTIETTRAQEAQTAVLFKLQGGMAGAAQKALQAADKAAQQAQVQKAMRDAAGPGQAGYIAKEIEETNRLTAAIQAQSSAIAQNVLTWTGMASAAETSGLDESLVRLGDASKVAEGQLAGLAEKIGVARASGQSFGAVATKVADDVVERWRRLELAKDELEKLTAAMEEAQKKHEEMNKAFGIGVEAAGGNKSILDLQASFGRMAQEQSGNLKGLGDQFINAFIENVRSAMDSATPEFQMIGQQMIDSIFGDLTTGGQIDFMVQELEANLESLPANFEKGGQAAQEIIQALYPVSPELAKIVAGIVKAHAATKGVTAGFNAWKVGLEGVAMLAQLVGGSTGDMINAIAGAADAFKNATTSAEKFQAVLTGLGQIGSILGNSLNPAIAKIGGALQGAVGGLKTGMAVGSIFGPMGTVVGGAIGAVGGAIFGFLNKSKKLREELKKMKESFVSSMGGMDALKKKAAEAGVSLDAMFKAKNAKDLESAISGIKSKLDTWDEAHEKLQAAIDKYGFTVDQLGPKFRQQELDTQAAELLQDYELLKASGIDLNLILEKMAPNMSEYVQTAIKAGSTIPMAMKPVIDSMIANGQLLDENGQAYASAEAAGITFAQTMSEQFQTLIEKINELVSALTGIPNVSRTVTVNTDYPNPGNPYTGDQPPESGKPYQGSPDYQAATGFHGVVSRPTKILAGEAGPEQVDITPKGSPVPTSSTSVTMNPSFHIDPLQSNAGREDLAKFLMAQFIHEARNSPILRQVLRKDGR